MIDTMDVTATNGVPFRVVYLPAGVESRNFADEYADEGARVEFYDRRYAFTEDGQFICRYFASALVDKPVGGLDLQGDVADWKIDTKTMFMVWSWIRAKQEA